MLDHAGLRGILYCAYAKHATYAANANDEMRCEQTAVIFLYNLSNHKYSKQTRS
jgi:hypothetical protein